ncbi:hypothetical protein EON67_12000 [archaeon]|nr:MAG: hypothetical protein EON67_12000 [archaeon]
MSASDVLNLGTDSFDAAIAENSRLLVAFVAPWYVRRATCAVRRAPCGVRYSVAYSVACAVHGAACASPSLRYNNAYRALCIVPCWCVRVCAGAATARS